MHFHLLPFLFYGLKFGNHIYLCDLLNKVIMIRIWSVWKLRNRNKMTQKQCFGVRVRWLRVISTSFYNLFIKNWPDIGGGWLVWVGLAERRSDVRRPFGLEPPVPAFWRRLRAHGFFQARALLEVQRALTVSHERQGVRRRNLEEYFWALLAAGDGRSITEFTGQITEFIGRRITDKLCPVAEFSSVGD